MAVDFCDYFWGEEHNGWNVLYQNMKQGQTAGKELAEFFKERWSIDEAYSKSLVKLSNKAGTNTEKGTCAPLFAVLKSSSEKLSNVHTVTVQRVQDLTKDVTKYNDELHKKHKGVKDEESPTEEIVKSIQATEGLAHKAKETYNQRCQDLEKVKRDGASPKEIEKAEAKLRKAHDEYKTLVEKYNTIRDEFERKLTISCQKFQTVEESHLGATLQFVQTYIEVLQTSQEAIGQIHTELLNQYNQFSIDKLLNTFALAKHTGLEKPNPMVFEDAGSIGSVISGQQSPEPGEASKLSAAEDVITTGGGGSSSGGGGSGSGLGGSSVLSGGFLRSRRDKKKEKKSKKVKGADTSSNKEEKSDNEGPCDDIIGSDLIMGPSSGNAANCSSSSSQGGGGTTTQSVDHEGFSIKPHEKINPENISIESSSESDSESEQPDKKIHVEIKPISNGGAPISTSIDELRATIEAISLSPVPSFSSTRRTSSENQESSMKRSSSITQQLSGSGSSAADLLGLDLQYSGGAGHNNSNTSPNPTTNNSSDTSITRPFSPQTHGQQAVNYSGQLTSPAPSVSSLASAASVASPILTAPPRADRYQELSELISSDVTAPATGIGTPDTPPVLPPRQGSTSRGSTPTPGIALPRPRQGPSPRGRQSPFPSSTGLSRAESVSSLDFRTTSMTSTGMGTSRGPSPLTIGMSDTIPLAIAFQELCHSYFRGTDEARCQVKVTGEMMVSFPAGIVGVLANNPSPAQLSFKVSNFSRIDNVLPNKQLITLNEEHSTEDTGVFDFNMVALTSLLKKQAENNPSASYFNVDMIKYQVSNISGAVSTPLQLVSYWKCEENHTDLRVDYKYNPNSMATPSALLNVNVSVPVDGVVKNMQSKPQGQWLRDQQRAVWKITELSQHSASGGVGSLRAKFEVAAGPSTPATIQGQFNCEGTTMSGLEFDLASSGYRVSLIKRRFVSGKYICDADAVLRLRYGSV